MPWEETDVEGQRMRFIVAWNSGEWNLSELCREFGVSRRIGYKYIARYEAEGLDGLRDRSRRPHRLANAMAPEVARRIVQFRGKHPTWGARKLKGRLERRYPDVIWPAASSIGELLDREGLISQRRVKPRPAGPSLPLSPMDEPNQVWCADFKGWFRTGDGQRCEPFTLMDGCTRFLLRCQAVEKTDFATLQPILDAAFREFGLPDALLTDNGPPFATKGLGGLSAMSVWLIKLEVKPLRIPPGKPQRNGRQERFHKTLKAETANPPAADRAAQQRRLQDFQREYNRDRPHEALGQETPASRYRRSRRPYPRRPLPPIYPEGWQVRRVKKDGDIHWRGGLLPVGKALAGEVVAMAPLPDPEERYWQLYFRKYPVAVYDSFYLTWMPEKEALQLVKKYPVEEDWCW